MAATMWTVWLVDMSVSGPIDRLGKVKGTDFLHFYVMGSIAHEGRWEQLFDVQAHYARGQAVVPGSAELYIPIESPQMALVFAPLAAHRYTVALALWLAVAFIMYACSCSLMWRDCTALHAHRHIVVPLCAAFPGLYSEVLHGQMACLALAAVAIALYALRRERRFAAGLALGSLVFKPHWVVAAGAVFFFAREWRVVAGVVASAVAQVAVTYLVLGASVMSAYWRMLRAIPRIAGLLEPQPGDSLRGLFKALMPFEPAALLMYGAAAFVTLLITARVWRSNAAVEIRLSAIVLAVILISPHVNAYDLILLAPIFFLLANWLVRSSGDTRARALSTWLCILMAAPILGRLPAIMRLQFSVTAMAAILFLLWRIVDETGGAVPTTHATASTRAGDWWSLRAPVIVSLLCSLVFIARTAFTVNGERYFTLFDDAMISMRYARNLAEGHGLLWNPGQAPVEGYTNFLWTLWMALLHLLPIPESKISLMVMLSGTLILVANLLVVRKIAARLAPEAPLAASLSIWLTALYYPLIYWTLRGMEVGLITLTISMSVLVALRLRDRVHYPDLIALAALMALGILTRPDVVVPCVVISGFVLWTARAESRRVVALVLVGSIVGTLAIHTTFRMLYYGAPVPNTYYLKVRGAALGVRLSRGLLGLLVFDLLHMIVPLALSSGYLIARARKGRGESGAYLLAAIFVVLCAYSVYVGGDVWESLQYANRYVTPAMPGLLVLSAMAIDDLLGERTRPRHVAIQGLACLFLLVGLASATVPVTLEDLPVTRLDERLRMARAALTLTPILVLALLLVPTPIGNRRLAGILTPVRRRSIVAVVLTVASLVAINGQAASVWLGHNAAYVEDDAWATRYGLALRAATADDATIAVTWAGAIPYFSHRPTIDLLGKSDRVIATRERQPTIDFHPGHDKWDYAYSIGQLRPDVVAELWHASQVDFRAVESWGYIRLAPWVFARADSTRIDRAALKEAACTILEGDPFVLGRVQRSVADLDERRTQYCR